MGSITGMLGLGGGAAGTGFSGPTNANITNPTTPEQIEAARQAAQQGMTNQNSLLNALQGQNGLQNQSNVYNQLQGIASGTGPNPALAQLNQSTAQNVAQQGALMASQRGASANPGMLARQAALQGGNIQQQAAGQAATMAAQQQLGAIGQAGSMAGNMAANQIGQTNANTQAQQAEQGQLLGAQGNYNNAAVGSQSSVNAGNAALAGQQMGGGQKLLGGAMSGLSGGMAAEGGLVKMAEGGSAFQGASQFGSFGGAPAPMMSAPGVASVNMPAPAGNDNALQNGMASATKKLMQSGSPGNAGAPQQGIGANASSDWAAAMGAPSTNTLPPELSMSPAPNMSMPDSGFQGTASYGPGGAYPDQNMSIPMEAKGGPISHFGKHLMASGGKVPALVSPGEKYLPPRAVEQVKKGANPMKVGETIPGKPKVAGAKNSYANDTVPKTLQEGGIVLPRSVTQSKDPSAAAAKFVGAIMKRDALKRKS